MFESVSSAVSLRGIFSEFFGKSKHHSDPKEIGRAHV